MASFLDQLVDKLFFTVITVTDELNAFKVFETLNSRGVRLSATDLLKNYLFSLVSSEETHGVELKALEERWEQIVGLLSRESFPEFLRVYWNSRNKLVRKSDLFKTIRREIQTREAAFELIRNLEHSAAVYAALRDPQDPCWDTEEQKRLKQLLMFNVRQPLSMLLACHARLYETERASFTRILRAIAVISFRYNVICSMQTNEQERVYNDVAWKVSQGTLGHAREILRGLHAVYPDDSTFRAAFADKELRTTNSRNRKVVRYLLFEIEQHRYGNDFEFESATYDLEHILPEKASEDWSHIDEAKQGRFVYRLANMTPLEKSRNRDLGNTNYEQKRNIYAQSCFKLTRHVAEQFDAWDTEKIEARQKQLAKVAASLWRIDF